MITLHINITEVILNHYGLEPLEVLEMIFLFQLLSKALVRVLFKCDIDLKPGSAKPIDLEKSMPSALAK